MQSLPIGVNGSQEPLTDMKQRALHAPAHRMHPTSRSKPISTFKPAKLLHVRSGGHNLLNNFVCEVRSGYDHAAKLTEKFARVQL